MTPRQARTDRRTAERKAKKAEMRRNREEFSPELIARRTPYPIALSAMSLKAASNGSLTPP